MIKNYYEIIFCLEEKMCTDNTKKMLVIFDISEKKGLNIQDNFDIKC